ncbi:MAG: Eco57I restriction-modification methylase domain-containing protein, partial [Chloroflexota bacterium]
MVRYAIQGGSDHIFDPAVGAGAFFRAAKTESARLGRAVALLGTEVDRAALAQALASGLTERDLAATQIRDFALDPPDRMFDAIVANPPYIRHHRLSPRTKGELRAFCLSFTGMALDGRAGLHVYFLLRALQRLAPGGRLAFILPADTCEGKFAPALWSWIAAHYRLDAIVTFAPDATPFPGVDTNAIIALIRHERPRETLHWAVCAQP